MPIDWMTDLEEATRRARAEQRPLFIDFWDYHCAGCEALEAETYPNPEVANLLTEDFVPVKINCTDHPELARQFGIFWTPTLVAQHHLGHPLRQMIGYLPPQEMRAALTLTRGLYAQRSAHSAESEALLHDVVSRFPASHAAPEAMYWQGVAAFRRAKSKDPLWAVWRDLADRYPASLWALKTTLLPAPVLR